MGIFDNKRIGRVSRALLRENSDYEKYGNYQRALAAAGATIHAHERFGDYQGTWLALVTYGRETGWVRSSFGSCTGCDAFEAEFGYTNEESFDKLADFGESYLDHLIPQAKLEQEIQEQAEWDSDAEAMLAFIKKHQL